MRSNRARRLRQLDHDPSFMPGLAPGMIFLRARLRHHLLYLFTPPLPPWPSLAFRLLSSSSAASRITVPGGKIASAPAFLQRLVVLRRHHAADHDHDVAAAFALASAALSSGTNVRCAGGERGHADDVHVVLHRLARGFGGRREQRPDVDVEAEIGERGAITFWPRSWPSWPILATRMRGRRPSFASNAPTARAPARPRRSCPTSRW